MSRLTAVPRTVADTRRKTPQRDWYSISVSSFRRGLTLLGLALALVGGSLAYQQWEQSTRRDRAEDAIAEAVDVANVLAKREDFGQLQRVHRIGWKDLEDAKTEFAAERYGQALSRARAALREFDSIFDLGPNVSERKSRFLSVQGGVEYRRGERGNWIKGRANDSLNPGDWIKTADDGVAEIRFPDGSTYVLRHDTLVHLGSDIQSTTGGEPVANLEFGWVEFNTGQSGSTIKTPKSEAFLEGDTEATITYDPDRAEGHYTTYAGSAQVTSTSGQTQQIGALEQVDQTGDLLSDPKPVPPSPRLSSPSKDQEIDFDTQKELRLAWAPIPDTQRYALNISRSQLFANNIIEDTNRRKASARIGIRGEGIFYWRVAAYGRNGSQGAWSETRSFRVASLRGIGDVDDKTPPQLTIDELQPYGSLVLVNGRTEPGATVTINGEPVSVQLNGSFSKTIQMTQVGFAFITIVAKDAWDNSVETQKRVFIDAF